MTEIVPPPSNHRQPSVGQALRFVLAAILLVVCVPSASPQSSNYPNNQNPDTTSISPYSQPVQTQQYPANQAGRSLPSSSSSSSYGINGQPITNTNNPVNGVYPDGRTLNQADILAREDLARRDRSLRMAQEPPTEFQRLVSDSIGVRLPIFGASLFVDIPATFAPVDNIPVTPDYTIGPGDELRIQVFGQVNQQGSFFVDRTGNISYPDVGTIHTAGIQYSQLQAFLKSQLSRVYRNFSLNVNLGELRSIQVFVVGSARQPGSYTVSALSTLLNALFASGGPLAQGSLRDIQLLRTGAPTIHFDFYDLLLHGDKSKDVQLAPGDVIFIPPVGPQVALAGSVNNPAIYEIGPRTTVAQLLALAGGQSSVAEGTQIRIERIFEHTMRNIINVELGKDQLAKNADTVLAGGDIITLRPILDRYKNAVTLRGNVAFPGRYVWHAGMRISDLVPNRDQLITREYYSRRNALGSALAEYSPQSAEELARIRNSTNPYGTNPYGSNPYGSNQYGNSPYGNNQYGNGPYGSYGASNNTAGNNGSANNQPGNNNAQGNGVAGNNPPGSNGANNNAYPPNSGPVGSLGAQGTNATRNSDSAAQSGMTTTSAQGGSSLGSALVGSNGLFPPQNDVVLSAPDLDWSYAVVERLDPKTLTTSLLPFNPGRLYVDGDQSQNLELQTEDVVTFFSTADLKVPTAQQTRFVRLEGEFMASGIYSVQPGETLRHLLERAGGFTSDAYLYGSEFTRQSTRRLQQQRLNEYADNLEAQVSISTSSRNAQAVSDRDAAAAAAAAIDARASIARLRRIIPVGRIVLELKPDSRDVSTIPDLPLEDGDRFIVPRVPSTVSVEGQVYSANAFVFVRSRHEHDYLRQAGGPDRGADRKRTFILRADGSVFSTQYGKVSKALMFPGDTIVVPPQLDRGSLLRNLLDFSSVIGQFGLGAATISILTR